MVQNRTVLYNLLLLFASSIIFSLFEVAGRFLFCLPKKYCLFFISLDKPHIHCFDGFSVNRIHRDATLRCLFVLLNIWMGGIVIKLGLWCQTLIESNRAIFNKIFLKIGLAGEHCLFWAVVGRMKRVFFFNENGSDLMRNCFGFINRNWCENLWLCVFGWVNSKIISIERIWDNYTNFCIESDFNAPKFIYFFRQILFAIPTSAECVEHHTHPV